MLDYTYVNGHESAYVTVLPKQVRVIEFMKTFGFTDRGQRKERELVLAKNLKPDAEASQITNLLDYHTRYGPQYYATNAPRFIVPIEPKYHNVLFPEAGYQMRMHGIGTMSAAGNGIQKAYLSRGSIRQISPGAILYFYRSHDHRALSVVGIVEGTSVSKSQPEITGYVGKRTVYPPDQIQALTENGNREVLAILFRQARVLRSGPSYEQLKEAKVCLAAPQSIMQASASAAAWLRDNIDRTAQ